MSDLCPERIRHIYQVLVGTIHREVHIRRRSPVHIARHDFADFDETTLEIIPWRIIQIVDTTDARGIVCVVVLCVVVVFHRFVQEVLARGKKEDGRCKKEGEYSCHNLFVYLGFHKLQFFNSSIFQFFN
jgi:hypothetical protein